MFEKGSRKWSNRELSQLKLNLEPERKITECLYGQSACKPLNCGDLLDFFSFHIFYGRSLSDKKIALHFIMRKKGKILQDFFNFFLLREKADVNAVFMENCFGINLENLLFYLIEALRERVVVFDGREVVG